MGGLGLIHPGFLAAGAAFVAVPVVLHLLFRRRGPRIDVGSLRFLLVAIRDNARRRKVQRWLLLALRVAGALLLGLLFARPYWSVPETPGEEREVAILIDRSASMGAGGPGRSAYSRAREAAPRLIASAPAGTAISLGFFDDSGVVPVAVDRFEGLAKAPGPGGTDYAGAIAWARDRMVQSRRKAREVQILTDLRRSGLARPATDDFPPGVKAEVVDVGRPLARNLAIEDARALRVDVRPEQGPTVSARVRNAGPFPERDAEVRLVLEGPGGPIQLAEKVTVEGSGRREVRFAPAIRQPGLYRGYVEVVGHDDLPFDDRRWLAFEARTPERILLVDGEPGPTPFANETYYLEAALRLRVPGATPSATPFEPRRIAWDGDAVWPDLADTRVVVLANVPDVPEKVAASLRTFVERGGGLVLFAGERVSAGSYVALRTRGILPARVEGTADGPVRFDSWDAGHPLLRPFSDPQHGDLRSLSFRAVARLVPEAGSAVLATARGGLPLVVEGKVGEGRVLILALAADDDRGDWSIKRLYLPLIHQMMGYLTGRLPGAGKVRDAPARLEDPPGFEPTASGLVVRNVDPAESEVDRATPAEFRSAMRIPEPVGRGQGGGGVPAPAPTVAGGVRPGESWRAVAWVLLVILVAETFVANRTPA